MKALIIAGGSPTLPGDTPHCLLQVENETLIEQQHRKLKSAGIEDIYITINDLERKVDYISDLEERSTDSTIITELGQISHLLGALDKSTEQDDESILLINGDVIINPKQLRRLSNSPYQNELVVDPAKSISAGQERIKTSKSVVSAAGSTVPRDDYPWYLYSGIAKVNPVLASTILREIFTQTDTNRSIVDIIGDLSSDFDIYVDESSIPGGSSQKTKSITGSSYAIIKKPVYFRKEVQGRGLAKLEDEIEFYRHLPESVAKHFPRMKDYYIGEDRVWLEQEFCDRPSLRDLLFNGVFNHQDALKQLNALLHFSFNNMYNHEMTPPDEKYLERIHFNRVWYRLYRAERDAEIFSDFLRCDSIEFNGREYVNIPPLISCIEDNEEICQGVTPKELSSFGHFDMHFQNILVSDQIKDFILVDPRGYDACDPYYDLGKISHSVNGLYDFIDTQNFKLDYELSGDKLTASVDFTQKEVLREYHQIQSELEDLFTQFTSKSAHETMMRVHFNEAMHFSSLIPFQLYNNPSKSRGVVSYLIATKLLNEFLETYAPDVRVEDYMGVSLKDKYERAESWKLKGE